MKTNSSFRVLWLLFAILANGSLIGLLVIPDGGNLFGGAVGALIITLILTSYFAGLFEGMDVIKTRKGEPLQIEDLKMFTEVKINNIVRSSDGTWANLYISLPVKKNLISNRWLLVNLKMFWSKDTEMLVKEGESYLFKGNKFIKIS